MGIHWEHGHVSHASLENVTCPRCTALLGFTDGSTFHETGAAADVDEEAFAPKTRVYCSCGAWIDIGGWTHDRR